MVGPGFDNRGGGVALLNIIREPHCCGRFEELYNVRLGYQAYEAGDMKGMVINQHTLIRALKVKLLPCYSCSKLLVIGAKSDIKGYLVMFIFFFFSTIILEFLISAMDQYLFTLHFGQV